MNRSGLAVRELLDYLHFRNCTTELLVAHDDLDIPFGRLRYKKGGGNAGHNGIKSITEELKTADFSRLRLGIGNRKAARNPEFVLDCFDPEEQARFEELKRMINASLHCYLLQGIERAMAGFNGRAVTNESAGFSGT